MRFYIVVHLHVNHIQPTGLDGFECAIVLRILRKGVFTLPRMYTLLL